MASVLRFKPYKMSLEQLSTLLRPLISSNFASVLRFAPSLTKYLVILLLLVNIRSWPLAWHCEFVSKPVLKYSNLTLPKVRVFRPVFRIRLQHKWMQWRNMFKSRPAQVLAEDKWLDSITPVGADPFNLTIPYRSFASKSVLPSNLVFLVI
jgi:hypothetical protein